MSKAAHITDQSSLKRALPPLGEEWQRFGVTRAWLFGSRSRGDASQASDWDFVVKFATPATLETFMGLKQSLEDKLNGNVDLISQSACKPRFLEAIKNELVDVT